MIRRLVRSTRRALRRTSRAARRPVNKVLRFFVDGVDVATAGGYGPTPCGGFEWRIALELARPSPGGGLIVQQVDEVRDIRGADGDVETRPAYWQAWEVLPGSRYTTLRDRDLCPFDDAYAEADRRNTAGSIDLFGTVRFFEGAALPPGMVPHNPDTPAGILPSTATRPPFFTPAGATDHDLSARWDCRGEAPAGARVTIAPRQAPSPMGAEDDAFAPAVPQGAAARIAVAVPPWTDGPYDARRTELLREAAAAACDVSDFALRAAVRSHYLTHRFRPDGIRELSRLFLLIRAVFAAPEWIPRAGAKVFGGWNHPSLGKPDQPSFRIAWPVAVDENGDLVVVGGYRSYRGLPYDAPADFDFFAARFGRR